MKKKPDRKLLALLTLIVGAACAVAAPPQKQGAARAEQALHGFAVKTLLSRGDS